MSIRKFFILTFFMLLGSMLLLTSLILLTFQSFHLDLEDIFNQNSSIKTYEEFQKRNLELIIGIIKDREDHSAKTNRLEEGLNKAQLFLENLGPEIKNKNSKEVLKLEQQYEEIIFSPKKEQLNLLVQFTKDSSAFVDKQIRPVSDQTSSRIYSMITQNQAFLLGTVFLAVLISISLCVWLFINSKNYSKKVITLLGGIHNFAEGKWDHTIKTPAGDEFYEISTHLNQMAQDIHEMNSRIMLDNKMTAVGLLSTGLTNELRNPLQSILGFAKSIEKGPDNQEIIKENTGRILDKVNKMTTIIDHLQLFGHQAITYKWQVTNVNKPIEDSLLLVKHELRARRIEVQLELGELLPKTWADPRQLEKVFRALLTNSITAYENAERVPKKIIRITSIKTEDGVSIIYEDNAGGMPEKVLDQIFDPFFTTKETGQGTGLGMSAAHGIIVAHQGSIIAKSTLGKGSRFDIILPEHFGLEA